jgi:hypothetical protein
MERLKGRSRSLDNSTDGHVLVSLRWKRADVGESILRQRRKFIKAKTALRSFSEAASKFFKCHNSAFFNRSKVWLAQYYLESSNSRFQTTYHTPFDLPHANNTDTQAFLRHESG